MFAHQSVCTPSDGVSSKLHSMHVCACTPSCVCTVHPDGLKQNSQDNYTTHTHTQLPLPVPPRHSVYHPNSKITRKSKHIPFIGYIQYKYSTCRILSIKSNVLVVGQHLTRFCFINSINCNRESRSVSKNTIVNDFQRACLPIIIWVLAWFAELLIVYWCEKGQAMSITQKTIIIFIHYTLKIH